MTILFIAVQSLSAQKVEDNQNDRYYKAREILENGGDRNKAAELLTENIDEYLGIPEWRFRSKGPQKTDDYFGVKPPKKDPIINRDCRKKNKNFITN